ncbi:MAG TPA: ribbon-helix-helix protein, CopG family [Stellaceae bacterium]|nr:ribbon-helix-helix protein, CopG family [Stellaceae bacterium]
MPDDTSAPIHVTLRVPGNVAARLDRLAALVERPRSWVLVRALRHYLKAEGAELLRDAEAMAKLDRGDGVPARQVVDEVDAIIRRGKARRGRKR